MNVLRLTRLSRGPFDQAIAQLREARLVRTEGLLYLEVAEEDEAPALRALAGIGVRAEPTVMPSRAESGHVVALGRRLSPVGVPLVADQVRVRRASLGAECGRLLARRIGIFPPLTIDRDLCRSLLHERDAAYRWDRRAWGSAAVMRDRELRGVLRPVVFAAPPPLDRSPEQRGFASDEALARWAFA